MTRGPVSVPGTREAAMGRSQQGTPVQSAPDRSLLGQDLGTVCGLLAVIVTKD